MNKYHLLGLLITTFTGIIAPAFAEESNLETVIVIGEQEDLITNKHLVGSIDLISREELAYEHVDDTIELFNKISGVYLSRYNQGIINADVAIRGFAGDGVTPHAKLLIDGIPSNLHNGFNELDQLFPINIESMTVFKGTSDPRYGIFNLAGNYNVATRQDDAKEFELTLGSFNDKEMQAYAGFSREGFTQNYSVGYRSSQGYRDHTNLDKYMLSGSWQWQFDDSKAFRVIARSAGYDSDSPGYFNDPQRAHAHPRRSESFARLDGGDKTSDHLSAHWSQDFSNNIQWQLKAYAQSFERERWVRFSEASTLRNRYDDQEQFGVISVLSWALNDKWSVDWGMDYEYQDVVEQRFNTVSTDSRERSTDPADIRRDRRYDFISYGTYLQLSHEPSDKLYWNIAIRADRLDGDFKNHVDPTNIESRDIFDFGTILQPKFNIVYTPYDTINLFANAGRSFQHPFGGAAYGNQDVSINDGWETGLQWSPSSLLTARLSYWQQNASDEFIEIDGTSRNVGETDRSGVDLAFNGALNDSWSYWGNVTTIDTEIVRANTSMGVSMDQGNELRGIPSYTASIGVNYQVTPKFVARLHFDAQGDYYINEANVGGKYGDFTLLNASADYDVSWATIKLQINNITDEYYEYAFDFGNDAAFTIHSPGDGINGSISLNWSF